MPMRSRTALGISEPQVKSPGPTNVHCKTMPMTVLAAQYRPTPAGVAMTNHENMAGIIHCIIVFIWRCCSVVAAVFVEMRCCIHIEAKTMATRK